MVVYEGDPPVRLDRLSAIAGGAVCNVSRLNAGVHSGTHIDAPVHFIDGAPGVEATPLDALIGAALVVDATELAGHLDAEAIVRLRIPADAERLLFKTSNSALWERETFVPDFHAITRDGAEALVTRGARLVGIDYLSVAPFGDPGPTHLAFLRAGVVILEGLDLRDVPPGPCQLVCLPMLIEGADGAPARAILIRDD
jgi:arylformamidase